jgi:hypothetical protein
MMWHMTISKAWPNCYFSRKPLQVLQMEDTLDFFNCLPKPDLAWGGRLGLSPCTDLDWKPPKGRVHIRFLSLYCQKPACRTNTKSTNPQCLTGRLSNFPQPVPLGQQGGSHSLVIGSSLQPTSLSLPHSDKVNKTFVCNTLTIQRKE